MTLWHVFAVAFAWLVLASSVFSQDAFFSAWQDRVRTTMAGQPVWAVPVVTASSGLVQLFRTDFVRQITSAGTTTWDYGNSKGLNVIPWYNVELDLAVPPYIQHNSLAQDGFGDFSMLLKYRIIAANEDHGAYSISVSLGGSIPTGSYKNGSTDASLTPTIHAGKGFGKFDVQSSLGAVLPTGHTAQIGRPLNWNVVGQYRLGKIWPEIENNATFFHGGPDDGRVQNFVTPGLMVSNLKLSSNAQNRLAVIFGGGEQIATSHFYSYNHGLIFTVRLAFMRLLTRLLADGFHHGHQLLFIVAGLGHPLPKPLGPGIMRDPGSVKLYCISVLGLAFSSAFPWFLACSRARSSNAPFGLLDLLQARFPPRQRGSSSPLRSAP